MSNQLFTDLTVEQQEVVAGGVDAGLSLSFFAQDQSLIGQETVSTAEGTRTTNIAASNEILTGGLTLVALGF